MRLANFHYLGFALNLFPCNITNISDTTASRRFDLFSDSLFRVPIPGEEITLPATNAPTGEYLLDKGLIEKISALRTFIENIESNRGKNSTIEELEVAINDDCKSEIDNSECEPEVDTSNEKPLIEINEENLEPIKSLLCEEDLLEEVVGTAIGVYKRQNDNESIQRLQSIIDEIIPIAAKFRKTDAEEKIVRLILCFTNGEEDFDDVLEELQQKKKLNKYLIQRLDELTKIAAKKYRISDQHPALSEKLLRIIKDRVASQMISNARGTDKYVRILAECFEFDECVDYEKVLKHHLTKIEDIEGFHEFLIDGIEYCREKKKLQDKIEKMESIETIVVRLHPIWTPVDDYIEHETTEMEQEQQRQKLLAIEEENKRMDENLE
ncbi:hypothetical protein BdWA1_001674 [Babesia duncani]|uniref:Uncharacterized protein n=1 Tax=Babesia duncani TaxID=323732 RepID=A0AAD9PKD5_9APIC|nr:hypothetical protein BdWA1_001674 [Babesia duncani]